MSSNINLELSEAIMITQYYCNYHEFSFNAMSERDLNRAFNVGHVVLSSQFLPRRGLVGTTIIARRPR